MANPICFTVADRSYFSLLKKEIHNLVTAAGFSVNKVGEIDIIVAEMVSNLIKHAGGGKLLAQLVMEEDTYGIELVTVDNGPGMADLSKMMVDGMSTKNSLGQGLGAIKRMSNIFQVYTQKGWGTILLARIFEKELPYRKKKHEIRSLVLPKTGEQKCGDGFYSEVTGEYIRIFSGDGLGHGEAAAVAVNEAIEVFKRCGEVSACDCIRNIHGVVKKTRGLVGTVAIFSIKDKTWNICGVGNIGTRIVSGIETKQLMAYNGIIGHNIPTTMKDTSINWENGQMLIMCSDGIKSRWEHTKFPSILKYDLSILNAAVMKDYARLTDDLSVSAIKLNF